MENTTSDVENKNTKRETSRLWQILRVIPIALLLISLVLIAAMFLMGGLMKITAWYLLQLIPPMLGLISLLAILIYAIVKRRFSRLLVVTLIFALVSLSPGLMTIRPVAFPASLEDTQPAATIRVPADVPLKVAWGGDRIETNYHAAVPDQRWAYDLLAEPYVTGSDQLEDYGCYGIPILAPASGLVTLAHDGEPDEVPGVTSNNIDAPTGNHVVIQLPDTGTYLVIAHMKPGSVTVKAGDSVEEGQKIGECGNSGNTSEPHIHIHHQRQDPAVFPLNFAEGLPLYFRDHDGNPMPVGGIEVDGETVPLIGDTIQHTGE